MIFMVIVIRPIRLMGGCAKRAIFFFYNGGFGYACTVSSSSFFILKTWNVRPLSNISKIVSLIVPSVFRNIVCTPIVFHRVCAVPSFNV